MNYYYVYNDCRFVGTYVNILGRVIAYDLSQFLLVFAVFAIAFGGGLYFALRGEPCTIPQEDVGLGFNPIVNTSLCLHPKETGYK